MKTRDGALFAGRTAEVREIDRRTIEEVGISGRVLMELAGAATAQLILERVGESQRVVVMCGPGNNGGDGYVIARHLMDAGWDAVTCLAAAGRPAEATEAMANRGLWERFGGVTLEPGPEASEHLQRAEVVVDALFGTGMSRPLSGEPAGWVERVNGLEAYRVAVDVPTGLDCDTGQLRGVCFKADLTATYGVSKVGLHQWPGRGMAGEVQVVQLAWPRAVCEEVGISATVLTEPAAARLLPRRAADAHKGHHGHLGVVGGAHGMEGAAVLVASGAFHAGVGLVSWNRPGGEGGEAVTRPPELMVFDATGGGLDARSRVFVVGPGLGQTTVGRALTRAALESGRPLVLDADALNLIATDRALASLVPAETIVTPHPAEAGRLLGSSTAAVQQDRLSAAQALSERFNAVVVLKGAATLVQAPGHPACIIEGAEPALAVGGSGDVLAGVIGALVAQGLGSFDAARLGAYLHAHGGRVAGMEGAGRGALASDIAAGVRAACGHLEAARPWWRGPDPQL